MTAIDTTIVEDTDIVNVRNLMNHTVFYTTSSGVSRTFAPYMTLKVTAGELRELHYTSGGEVLLKNYICVENEELAKEFGVSEDVFEHEYKWTRKDMERVLLEDDTAVLEDAFDFAPQGVKDELIACAIELELPSVPKRDVIKTKTGVDVSVKIENKHLIEADLPKEPKKPKKRRAAKKSSTGRKAEKTTAKKSTEK